MDTRAYAAVLAAVVAAALLAGCGVEQDPDSRPGQEDSMSPTPTDPTSSTSPARVDPVAQAIVDLAQRQGVAPEEVEVVAREEVTWRNGSLGCAKPGEFYTQALVDGGRIILRVGEATYEYHYGARRAPFWCENPTQ